MGAMRRAIEIPEDLIEFSLTLRPEDRLRQANAAFRLFHALHNPFARPFLKPFDRIEDFLRHEEEDSLPR